MIVFTKDFHLDCINSLTLQL